MLFLPLFSMCVWHVFIKLLTYLLTLVGGKLSWSSLAHSKNGVKFNPWSLELHLRTMMNLNLIVVGQFVANIHLFLFSVDRRFLPVHGTVPRPSWKKFPGPGVTPERDLSPSAHSPTGFQAPTVSSAVVLSTLQVDRSFLDNMYITADNALRSTEKWNVMRINYAIKSLNVNKIARNYGWTTNVLTIVLDNFI